jgi:hypothetical protein
MLMSKFLKRIFIYSLAVLLLLAMLMYAESRYFKFLPNDYSRHKTIVETIKNKYLSPEILVFGDSKAMFGVNAKTISNNLINTPIAFNLSSPAQSVSEGSYFFSKLPASTKHIIHCIDYSEFSYGILGLEKQVALSMRFYDFEVDPYMEEYLDTLNPVFFKSNIKILYEARNMLRTAFHNEIRKVMDNEPLNESLFHDIYFPHTYTLSRHPNYPNYSVEFDYDKMKISNEKINFLLKIDKFLQKRGIKYHLIIMPINPDLYQLNNEAHNSNMTKIKELIPKIDVVDLTGFLNNQDFYDGFHPNKNGAEKLSKEISKRLN